MASARKKKATQRFLNLVRGGSISKSKYLDKSGKGLSHLSTESLQIAKGQAPKTGVNIVIGKALQLKGEKMARGGRRRRTSGKY